MAPQNLERNPDGWTDAVSAGTIPVASAEVKDQPPLIDQLVTIDRRGQREGVASPQGVVESGAELFPDAAKARTRYCNSRASR